jgi:hypothetical protein
LRRACANHLRTKARITISHVVTIQTQIKDIEAVRSACKRLALAPPEIGTAKLYSAQSTGIIVKLKGWVYPIVIDPQAGSIAFDNYEGDWGHPKRLEEFRQAYAIAKATIEARKKGHTVVESRLANGSVKLTITTSGR